MFSRCCAGYPLVIAAVLWFTTKHKKFNDPQHQLAFGFIYARYEAKGSFYEIATVLRRTLFVVIYQFSSSPRLQCLLAQLLLIAIWLLHIRFQP